MTIAFSPNGCITHETCPECQTPDVKVEHGHETEIDEAGNAKDTGHQQQLWHCPECGECLSYVLFDCPECGEATQ